MEQLQQYFLENEHMRSPQESPIPSEISFHANCIDGDQELNLHLVKKSLDFSFGDEPSVQKSYNPLGKLLRTTHQYFRGEESSSGSSGCAPTEAETESDCSSLSDGSSFWPDSSYTNQNEQVVEEERNEIMEVPVEFTVQPQFESDQDFHDLRANQENKKNESVVPAPLRSSPRRKQREVHPRMLLQNKTHTKKRSPRSRRREVHPSALH